MQDVLTREQVLATMELMGLGLYLWQGWPSERRITANPLCSGGQCLTYGPDGWCRSRLGFDCNYEPLPWSLMLEKDWSLPLPSRAQLEALCNASR